MGIKRIAIEMGQGTSLRTGDYTRAARRAIENALWKNSLTVAQGFGFSKNDMIVDAVIGVQRPEKVKLSGLKDLFPYGRVNVVSKFGGLDIPKTKTTSKTIIANAVLIISFDMEIHS